MQMENTGRQPHILSGETGWVVLLQLGGTVTEHAHPYGQTLIKVGGPDREILVGNEKRLLTDSNFIFVDPWVPHGGLPAIGREPTHMLAVNFGIPPNEDLAPRRFCASRRRAESHYSITRELRQQADHLCRSILHGTADFAEARAIIQALRLFDKTRLDRTDPSHISDYRIRRVVECIHVDPTIVRDIDACAGIAGLSRPHFFYLFRENTGLSPRLLANSIRLETAISRLATNAMPIRAIGETLGFSAPGHFTRFFLHHIGITPRAFRRAMALYHGLDG